MGNEQIKVIHIDTEKSWRGGQQQAVYLFEGLLKRGIESWMICPPGSAMEKYCRNKSLPYYPLTFAHELDYISGIDTAKIASINGAGILQLHSGHSVSWGLWAKLFNRKIKLVATRRVDFSIKKNPLSILKYNTRLLNKIVCISDKIKDVLIHDGIVESKLKVIKSGINIHKFDIIDVSSDFKQKWGIAENSVLVGTVAAFSGHKDYPNLLKSAFLLLKKSENLRFMLVGDGELLKSMKDYARQLNITDKVIFTGFQPDVGRFLKAFDIFVLASKKEGLGTSVLDAMSVGLPIVATKAGGIPEMIETEKNGILVPIKDPEALADALWKLINSTDLRKKLGEAAKLSVSDYDINNTIDSYITLYQEMSNEQV